MTILPNQLNITCILVSKGYLVSKGNKDGVALALVTAPPRSHRKCGCVQAENEELSYSGSHWEKMLSKKRCECVSRVWRDYLGSCVRVCELVTISVSILYVFMNVAVLSCTCVCIHDKSPLYRCCWQMSLNQVFISIFAWCSSFKQASVRRYIWSRSQWHTAIYVR